MHCICWGWAALHIRRVGGKLQEKSWRAKARVYRRATILRGKKEEKMKSVERMVQRLVCQRQKELQTYTSSHFRDGNTFFVECAHSRAGASADRTANTRPRGQCLMTSVELKSSRVWRMCSTSSATSFSSHHTERYIKCHASFADIRGVNSSLLHNLAMPQIRAKKPHELE